MAWAVLKDKEEGMAGYGRHTCAQAFLSFASKQTTVVNVKYLLGLRRLTYRIGNYYFNKSFY